MSKRSWKVLYAILIGCTSLPLFGATWYIRSDGGTRYTPRRVENHLSGQCDGLSDLPYSGHGTNQHCAFNDVRFLWGDATYNGNRMWVISGGDTVILRGSLQTGNTYRVGWPNASSGTTATDASFWGVPGDPYGSGPPAPPSGSAASHTRILGENYANCHTPAARTQLHGGFGVYAVLNMEGASYVDLQCLDITDFSSCGRAAQIQSCNTSPGALDDYASNGIIWSKASTHDTLIDVSIHGLAGAGMLGPTGDGTLFRFLSLTGNASSGWNADSGNASTGTGSLLVQNFDISWNGCAEEYPIVDALPYGDCTDDNVGGYGDGFGTATLPSSPAWIAVFDNGVVSYNTQDGLDALHLGGHGSSMTVSHTLAFGNMGQQIKIGGAAAVLTDNIVYTSCNALRQSIPGTSAGYNKRLTDFCRAADTGILFSVNDGSTTLIERNIIYSASVTALQAVVTSSCNSTTCLVRQRDNIFIGFKNSRETGYSGGGNGEYPNPLYLEDAEKAYRNPGSSLDHNTTYHAKGTWLCPALRLHETNAKCSDPHLSDESWHLYGYGNTSLLQAR